MIDFAALRTASRADAVDGAVGVFEAGDRDGGGSVMDDEWREAWYRAQADWMRDRHHNQDVTDRMILVIFVLAVLAGIGWLR